MNIIFWEKEGGFESNGGINKKNIAKEKFPQWQCSKDILYFRSLIFFTGTLYSVNSAV